MLCRSLLRNLLPPLWRHVLGALATTLSAKSLSVRVFAIVINGSVIFLIDCP